jgi:hypothetical protein
MRPLLLPFVFLFAICSAGQEAASVSAPTRETSLKSTFLVRYVNGSNVYINGGRDSGIAEGAKLVVKQDPTKAIDDNSNIAIEPGVVAKLTVVSVASNSAVCEVEASSRELIQNDVVSLPDAEVEKLIEKDTLGNTRKYPIVVSFSEGDPLDEEVRESVPRPPLPEVNQFRGRMGFDVSTLHGVGQFPSTSNSYGMVVRVDATRLMGTHWNLSGYWRGTIHTNSTANQTSLQDLINRTYLMGMTYINPESRWTAGIGRLYVPWASSLETVDGAYVGRQLSTHSLIGIFAGSTPDPTAWNYNPQRRIGGMLFNAHGGSFDSFRYTTTVGYGMDLLKWTVNRPFIFTENNFSFKRVFSLYHSMQIDHPAPNPGMPAIGTGLGRSLFSMRVQVHPRVALDLTDTYFRDVPTYDPTLVGTGLLDKYLYQGVNGGARIEFPWRITGYFSLGSSIDSNDPKNSINRMFGMSMANIWKTGLTADARYAQFDSSFASGTYTTITVSRDMLDNLRLNLQIGKYAYTSSVAANSISNFGNLLFDTNLGARLFLESMLTVQRGGSLNYNQWTTTLGYRFDNRARHARSENPNGP